MLVVDMVPKMRVAVLAVSQPWRPVGFTIEGLTCTHSAQAATLAQTAVLDRLNIFRLLLTIVSVSQAALACRNTCSPISCESGRASQAS